MRAFAIVAAALLACCAPSSDGLAASLPAGKANSVHPVSGLLVIPLTISQNGKVHHFRVEVAVTPAQQAKGLMFRTKMAPDEGMIFPENPPRLATFWMKNTVIPLDIIFIGTDHRIMNVSANATPYSLDPLPSDDVASGVLELNGGRLAELGFTPGAKVEW